MDWSALNASARSLAVVLAGFIPLLRALGIGRDLSDEAWNALLLGAAFVVIVLASLRGVQRIFEAKAAQAVAQAPAAVLTATTGPDLATVMAEVAALRAQLAGAPHPLSTATQAAQRTREQGLGLAPAGGAPA